MLLFSVSGPICVAITSLFGIFSDRVLYKKIFAVLKDSLLKVDSQNSENLTPKNNIQYTVFGYRPHTMNTQLLRSKCVSHC